MEFQVNLTRKVSQFIDSPRFASSSVVHSLAFVLANETLAILGAAHHLYSLSTKVLSWTVHVLTGKLVTDSWPQLWKDHLIPLAYACQAIVMSPIQSCLCSDLSAIHQRTSTQIFPASAPALPEVRVTTAKPEEAMPLVAEPKSSSKWRKYVWVVLGAAAAYHLIDHGLSSLLVLRTLRHGTGPKGFLGISLFGADPNYGGHAHGSSAGAKMIDAQQSQKCMRNSKGYFHLFKHDRSWKNFGERSIYTRSHAILSGIAWLGGHNATGASKWARVSLGGLIGLLTPSLKFHFRPEEATLCSELGPNCQFENDPDYLFEAFRTPYPIPANRIGITGSLLYGLDAKLVNRILENKGTALYGLALLIAGGTVAKKTIQYARKPTENSVSAQKLSKRQIWQTRLVHYVAEPALMLIAATFNLLV